MLRERPTARIWRTYLGSMISFEEDVREVVVTLEVVAGYVQRALRIDSRDFPVGMKLSILIKQDWIPLLPEGA